jgi:hypothetical protein
VRKIGRCFDAVPEFSTGLMRSLHFEFVTYSSAFEVSHRHHEQNLRSLASMLPA